MPGESVPQGLWLPPRVATLLVAANDALDRTRAQADYICDGVADEIQINLALNALPAGGGRVVLSEGTFTLAHSITIPASYITLEGNGWTTFIDGDGLPTTEHGIVLSGFSYVHIKNLRIQTLDGGGKTCHCIFIEDGANEFVIDRVCIFESDSDGIHIEGTSINKGWIQDCYVEGADGNGIFVDMDAGDIIQNLIIKKNIIHSCGVDGIHFWNTGGPYETCIIEGNNIASCVGCGIYIWDSVYFTISGNVIDTVTAYGIRLRVVLYSNVENNVIYRSSSSGIMLEAAPNNTIAGNFIIDTQDAVADGIEFDSVETKVLANYLYGCGRYGIIVTGARSSLIGNTIIESGDDGVYIRAAEVQVKSNYIYDNGQDAAGTYHGIKLNADADKCQISDNFISSPGDSQEDGIHLEDGAQHVQIVGNYCFDGMGSGIALAANNVDCHIEGNYVYLNDDEGIEVLAGCLRTSINNNHCIENGRHGITCGGAQSQINDNYCVDNSQTTTNTYHGINITEDGDRCHIEGNFCYGGVAHDMQEDGIHLVDGAEHCSIVGNFCYYLQGDGIALAGNNTGTLIQGNKCYYMEDENGIVVLGSTDCQVVGNHCMSNYHHGIFLSNADRCSVVGNTCINNDRGASATYDGIFVNSTCVDVLVNGNFCYDNDRVGIYADGIRTNVNNNVCQANGTHGIYVNAVDCKVQDNHCFDNSQNSAGASYGIALSGGADRCTVVGNTCDDPGDSQGDGINLADGAAECQICNNYCYNAYGAGASTGNGITLAANNDNCLITDNYCYLNDGYGIEIVADTCDKNIVRGNRLTGNVTGAISDIGTLTQVEDDNEGIDVIDIKMYRTVKNTSGTQRVAGDVVIIKGIAVAIEVTTTVTQGDDKVYGMVAETIANDASGYVLVKGYTAVLKVDGTIDIAIDDPLGTFTTACIAMKAAAGDQAFALALEAYASDDSNGVIYAYIKSPWD